MRALGGADLTCGALAVLCGLAPAACGGSKANAPAATDAGATPAPRPDAGDAGDATSAPRPDAGDATPMPDAALSPIPDADLYGEGDTTRLNQIRARGTHNSYHLRPDNTVPEWQYDHLPLDQQANDLNVRQFELDVHFRPDGTFHVYHIPAADDRSTCDRFTDCLEVLRTWQDTHPRRVPLVVLIEPKDDVDAVKVRDHLPELEAEIASVFGRGRVLAPGDVIGDAPDLRTAVTTRGWPLLETVRGRTLFVLLDEGTTRDAYLALHPVGPDRDLGLLFVPGPEDDPASAFLLLDDATGEEARIAAAVQAGFLVRTMAGDDEKRAAALRSGAHFISGDAPELLLFDGAPGPACNPARSTPACVTDDLEDESVSPP